MRETLWLVCGLALLLPLVVTSCSSNSEGGRAGGGTPHTPDGSSWIGQLEGGIMHIGGEGTGWVLRTDDPAIGQQGTIDVDISRVTDQARAFSGRRVRIEGRLFEKRYVERGPVMILAATAIRAAE